MEITRFQGAYIYYLLTMLRPPVANAAAKEVVTEFKAQFGTYGWEILGELYDDLVKKYDNEGV